MHVSKKALEEFKEIYKDEFGVELSDDKAREMTSNLLRLFQIITRPLPSERKKKENDSSTDLAA